MDRAEVLRQAKACVCGQRQDDYGTPENSFKVIGELWEVYIKEKCVGTDTIVTIVPEDVAALLGLLKIARIATGNGKDDNWIDLAGYAACGGELQSHHMEGGCDHQWECIGADTRGTLERCRICGAQKSVPATFEASTTAESAANSY